MQGYVQIYVLRSNLQSLNEGIYRRYWCKYSTLYIPRCLSTNKVAIYIYIYLHVCGYIGVKK